MLNPLECNALFFIRIPEVVVPIISKATAGEFVPIPTLPSLKMVTAVADALSSIPVEAKLLITPPST